MKRTVAVFGGSFNPPHIGHVMVVVYVLSIAPVDEVLVVPCFIHPFSKQLASYDDRLEMCLAAFGWIPRVTISAVERDLGGESRTLRTLQALATRRPDWSLRLVVGSDILPETSRWHGFPEIEKLAPLLVLDRPSGSGPPSAASLFPDVSSSAIRAALARQDLDAVSRLIPAPVLDHIRKHHLFVDPGS